MTWVMFLKLCQRVLLGVGLVLCLTQCQTIKLGASSSGSGKSPQIEVEGVYEEQIVDACGDVFQENGYRFAGGRRSHYLYEKPGSTMDFLAWGGFSTDEEIVERLKVRILDLGSSASVVECQAYIVLRPGEHMEEARKVSRLKNGKYQKLLDQVGSRITENALPIEDLEGVDNLEDWDAWD